MRWQVLAALTNGWLWLLAIVSTVVLVLSPAPLWFSLMTGGLVLVGGALTQGAVEWRRMSRGRGRSSGQRGQAARSARVDDAQARAIIARAHAAAERARRIRAEDPEAPADIMAGAEVATHGAVTAMGELGQQVDRLNRAMSGINPRAAHEEVARLESWLADAGTASPDLVEQRRAMVTGLRAQLDAYRRLSEQRELVLARMRTAAIELEGLAVRLGEIGALYSAQADGTTHSDRELQAVTTQMDDLRLGLEEAERTLRRSLEPLE